jgi:hypothetical protein
MTDIVPGIKAYDWHAVRLAADSGHVEVLKYFASLTDIVPGIKAYDWDAVRWAADSGHVEVLQYFSALSPEIKNYIIKNKYL